MVLHLYKRNGRKQSRSIAGTGVPVIQRGHKGRDARVGTFVQNRELTQIINRVNSIDKSS